MLFRKLGKLSQRLVQVSMENIVRERFTNAVEDPNTRYQMGYFGFIYTQQFNGFCLHRDELIQLGICSDSVPGSVSRI